MKYIIVQDFSGQEVPFIFPRRVDHADFRDQLPYGKVVAAGFVQLTKDGFVCTGGDTELNLKAREQIDAEVIREALRPR
ncbi:MAG: hypothetical protein IJT59_03180 [Desulfovibrionaceae bacterium]|nr:hypothetical protein [Desulfovibrionaceae bacterium]